MVSRPEASCCQAAVKPRSARRRASRRRGSQPQAAATLNKLRQLLGATTSSRAAVTSSRAWAACRAGRQGAGQRWVWLLGSAAAVMRTADNSSETGCKREQGPEQRQSAQACSFCTAGYTSSRSGLPAAPQQHPCPPPHLRERCEVDALREALAQAGGAKHRLLQLRQRLHALLAGLARKLVLGGLQLLRQAEGCAACFRAAGGTGRREGTAALRPCRRSKLHVLTPPMP